MPPVWLMCMTWICAVFMMLKTHARSSASGAVVHATVLATLLRNPICAGVEYILVPLYAAEALLRLNDALRTKYRETCIMYRLSYFYKAPRCIFAPHYNISQ